jgi:hypothetical protein
LQLSSVGLLQGSKCTIIATNKIALTLIFHRYKLNPAYQYVHACPESRKKGGVDGLVLILFLVILELPLSCVILI